MSESGPGGGVSASPETEGGELHQNEREIEPLTAIRRSLQTNQHFMLFGPPGTGKTHAIKQVIDQGNRQNYMDSEFEIFYFEGQPWVTLTVQFTPSTSDADLISGIMIGPNGEFESRKGWLLKMNEILDNDDTLEGGLLVIDEFSRADVMTAIGPLMLALEHGDLNDRINGELLKLNQKLILAGTLNTADKSVRQMDRALLRRFHWIPMNPDVSVLEEWMECVLDPNGLLPDTASHFPTIEDFQESYPRFMKNLNRSICEKIGQDSTLGQALFYPTNFIRKAREITIDDVLHHLRYSLIPGLRVLSNADGRKLANWLTQDSAKRIVENQVMTNDELFAMIHMVSQPLGESSE